MSTPERRRHDRLPRRTSGGMHPGWACFMSAHWAGFFLGVGFAAVMVRADAVARGSEDMWSLMPAAIPFAIWVGLFVLGGKKAEKLRDSP